MRKRLCQVGCILLLIGAVVVARDTRPSANDEAARAAAVRLWKSLTEDQKKLALCDFNDKDRYSEVFPETKRKGIPYSMLTAEQRAMTEEVVRGMCSEYGATRCLEVAKQTKDAGRYLTYYGEPEPGKPFAWRIAMHHLTLIYAEFGTDKSNEFGPVLLGGNPVKDLWDPEEKILLELRASLSEDEVKKVVKTGGKASGAPIDDREGVKIGELSEKPKALAKKLLDQRLAVFSADRRKVLEKMIAAEGGVEALRIGLWGDAGKGQMDGGNYCWKIGGATVLVDWQTAGKNHIHMTVRGRGKS
jgi:hypothetical protein